MGTLLGTTLILQLFPGEEYRAAAIPTAAYTFGCVFAATILAYFWSRIPVRDGDEAAKTPDPDGAIPASIAQLD